jgi:hypothetical protein
VTIGATIENNRVSVLISKERFFTVMAKNTQLTPGGHKLILGIGGMRTVTTGTFTGSDRTVNNFFVRNAVVTFVAERRTLSRKHIRGDTSMGIVTRGATILKSRMDVRLPTRLIVMAFVTERFAFGGKHIRRGTGMRVMTSGTTILKGGVNTIHPFCLAIVTTVTERVTGLGKHLLFGAGMRIMAGSTAILQGRMLIFPLRLIIMTTKAESVTVTVEKFIVITLVGTVAADAVIFSGRVRMG